MTPEATPSSRPLGLIGGIGITEVHVYAQHAAPDGTFSGCPHVHAITDEAYFVFRGSGRAEFHDTEHGMRQVRLTEGEYVEFPPGTVHRLISDGDLVVLGLMGNAGLAERGEARIYFGREVDDNPAEYARLMSLPKSDGLSGALLRRDTAVRAYGHLLHLWHTDRRAYDNELLRFVDCHRRAMAPLADSLAHDIRHGPMQWASATLSRAEALPQGAPVATQVVQNSPGDNSALGMCGILRPILNLRPLK